ncbi:MAG: HEPN domain-containing protein [Devosia sp.]|nr:HEPN domain-containing protein [Devosia sp.]
MSLDLQRQFDTATAYFLAGERCSLEMRFGRYEFHSIGAPTITNYAFSVELALKLIHTLSRGVQERGHDLRELYDALPEEIRTKLSHLADCVEEIARYFEDWRYPFEKDFLVADQEEPRRAFIECYREIRRLRPGLLSVYERLWGAFEPDWSRPWAVGQSIEAKDPVP